MFPVRDENDGNSIKYVTRLCAKVTNNVDPDKLGRIEVFHPLLGTSTWVPYLTLPGMFSVPEIEDMVYVECDSGYETNLIAWGNKTKSEDNTLPEVFKRTTPSNRGFYSPAGHLVELDDGEDAAGTNKGIRITSAGGNKITLLEDTTAPQGLITIETSGGAKLEVDGTNGITVVDGVGNEVAMTSSGIKLTEFSGGTLNLSTNKVALGNSTLETVDVISQTLQFLADAFTALSTTTAPGFGAPISSVAQFATYATQASALKTQVDSILKGSV